MSKDELDKILDPKDHSWIKVKHYSENDEFSLIEWGYHDEALKKLKIHHQQETEFLIKKCRQLASELKKYI